MKTARKPDGKRPFGRPKQRRMDKTENNQTEIGVHDGERERLLSPCQIKVIPLWRTIT